MKPTADIKLTKDEVSLLLQILDSAMGDSDSHTQHFDIKRIYNKVWAEKVVLQDALFVDWCQKCNEEKKR